jgi:hypothetical protein
MKRSPSTRERIRLSAELALRIPGAAPGGFDEDRPANSICRDGVLAGVAAIATP